jgi:hypothetical protein
MVFATLSAASAVLAVETCWTWLLVPHFLLVGLTAVCLIATWRGATTRARAGAVVAVLLLGCAYTRNWLAIESRAAEESDHRDQARHQLRELGLLMSVYYDKHGQFPPAALRDATGRPLLSWRVALLPLIEEPGLYREFKLDEAWDSNHNRDLLTRMPAIYAAPHRGEVPLGMTVYQVFVGPGTIFDPDRPVRLPPTDFPGGPRDLILIAEAADAVPWTKPADLVYAPDRPLPPLGSVRKYGGRPVLFVPQPVRWMVAVDANCGRLRINLDEADEQMLRHHIALSEGDE